MAPVASLPPPLPTKSSVAYKNSIEKYKATDDFNCNSQAQTFR